MAKVNSKDGTTIAYDKQGSGPAVILVDGAMGYRAFGKSLQLGQKVGKLALYEPPYNTEPGAREQWLNYRKQVAEAIATGRKGDAVTLFMQLVGVPAEQIEGMRQAPMWPMLEAVAPTLPYDAADIGEDRTPPVSRAAHLKMPVLVMDGGANFTTRPFMHATANTLGKAIPHAQQRTLEGQTHDVSSEALAPVLIEFFSQ